MSIPKIIIIPGNGDTHIETDHWYAWVRDQLKNLGFTVVANDMPDPVMAHKNIWLPYIKNELKVDENTIIIGHSSGGVATLRFLEDNPLLGAIVIGVNHTDLGDKDEKESGYFEGDWKWDKIKQNAKWIAQFASQDDPYIPISQARFIHEKLNTEYHECTDRGHFGSPGRSPKQFPEVIEVIKRKLNIVPVN